MFGGAVVMGWRYVDREGSVNDISNPTGVAQIRIRTGRL